MTAVGTRERRWIILGEDGRHVTIGRHTDPTDDELARAAEALRSNGQGGWLAVTEGTYYRARDSVTVMLVRELAPTSGTFEAAAEAFHVARRCALAPSKPKQARPV